MRHSLKAATYPAYLNILAALGSIWAGEALLEDTGHRYMGYLEAVIRFNPSR